MNDDPVEPQRIFTVEQVNAMLPLVKAIVKDLVELARDVVQRRERLANVAHPPESRPGDPYDQELAQVEDELEKDGRRLQEYVRELRGVSRGRAEGWDRGPGRFPGHHRRPDSLSLLEAGGAGSSILARSRCWVLRPAAIAPSWASRRQFGVERLGRRRGDGNWLEFVADQTNPEA